MKRITPEISAGSMADIAFLLLIFFLVTTTIDVDKGITVKLPPWCEGPDCVMPAPGESVFSVAVNLDDHLLVEDELTEISNLKAKTKKFLIDLREKKDRSGVISLRNDRATSYDKYVAVYNELRAAYNEIWETEAQSRFQMAYEDLDRQEKFSIRKDFPLLISEAEPTDFAVN